MHLSGHLHAPGVFTLVPIMCCCVGRMGLLTEWLRGISILHRDQNPGPPIFSSLTEPRVFFYRSEVTHVTGSDCICCPDWKRGGGRDRSGQPLRWFAVKVIGLFPYPIRGWKLFPLRLRRFTAISFNKL